MNNRNAQNDYGIKYPNTTHSKKAPPNQIWRQPPSQLHSNGQPQRCHEQIPTNTIANGQYYNKSRNTTGHYPQSNYQPQQQTGYEFQSNSIRSPMSGQQEIRNPQKYNRTIYNNNTTQLYNQNYEQERQEAVRAQQREERERRRQLQEQQQREVEEKRRREREEEKRREREEVLHFSEELFYSDPDFSSYTRTNQNNVEKVLNNVCLIASKKSQFDYKGGENCCTAISLEMVRNLLMNPIKDRHSLTSSLIDHIVQIGVKQDKIKGIKNVEDYYKTQQILKDHLKIKNIETLELDRRGQSNRIAIESMIQNPEPIACVITKPPITISIYIDIKKSFFLLFDSHPYVTNEVKHGAHFVICKTIEQLSQCLTHWTIPYVENIQSHYNMSQWHFITLKTPTLNMVDQVSNRFKALTVEQTTDQLKMKIFQQQQEIEALKKALAEKKTL